jgi:hypothetical protein
MELNNQEKFRQIMGRYEFLGWLPREDLDWILATLAELLENG